MSAYKLESSMLAMLMVFGLQRSYCFNHGYRNRGREGRITEDQRDATCSMLSRHSTNLDEVSIAMVERVRQIRGPMM